MTDPATTSGTFELTSGHEADVGGHRILRALPHRGRRTVGAWCFADHMVPSDEAMGIGPHPHIGLQTVTWLLAGELFHTDSLGSEQPIRPGQLNLMTAGHGIAHAEESSPNGPRPFHGVQLWVAQPDETREGAPAFEHHAELPRVELDTAIATVLIGEIAGTASPARRDTDHAGADVALRPGRSVIPVDPTHEHGVIVLDGAVQIDHPANPAPRDPITPGHLVYLGVGLEEVAFDVVEPTRLLLLAGTPWPQPPVMAWNYVARSRQEIRTANDQWNAGDPRFGPVRSSLPRIPGPPL